jgi:hypothetical protein
MLCPIRISAQALAARAQVIVVDRVNVGASVLMHET